MYHSTRRRLLRAGSAGAVVGLAGCSSLGGSPDSAGQRLGAVGVFNDTDDALSVSILIVRDGEKRYWRTHELATDGSLHVEPPEYTPGRG